MIELANQGGFILLCIVIASFLAWTLAAAKWLRLRVEVGGGLAWTDDVLQAVAAGRIEHAGLICRSRGTAAGRVLREAIAHGRGDRDSFSARLAPLLRVEQVELSGGLGLVAVLAELCPLLGLLGTVVGMVMTFEGVSAQGMISIEHLADGVSGALITTQAGLAAGLPLLLVHGYLQSRIEQMFQRLELRIKQIEAMMYGES